MTAGAYVSGFGMLGGRSRSMSMRCEVDLTREALGLRRFICFTGRRSEAENIGYVWERLLSKEDTVWVFRRA